MHVIPCGKGTVVLATRFSFVKICVCVCVLEIRMGTFQSTSFIDLPATLHVVGDDGA